MDDSFTSTGSGPATFSFTNPGVGGSPARPAAKKGKTDLPASQMSSGASKPPSGAAARLAAPVPAHASGSNPIEKVVVHQLLPSYELLAFLRIAGLEHEVVDASHSGYSATGDLPQIQHGRALVGAKKALPYLRTVAEPLGDAALSATSRADASVWMSLVHNTLGDLLLWSMLFSGVLDSSFFHSGSSAVGSEAGGGFAEDFKAFAAAFSPSRILLPALQFIASPIDAAGSSLASRASAYLHFRGLNPLDAHWAEIVAAAAYSSLATRYQTRAAAQEGPFFFGRQPTTLDAAVFGHLASARGVHPISQWAKKYAIVPALGPFFQAFASTFFSDDPLLGAFLFRSLDAKAISGEAAPTSEADVAALVARPSVARSAYRQREALYLHRLRKLLLAAPGAPLASAEAVVQAFPLGFGATPKLLGLPRHYRLKAMEAFPSSSSSLEGPLAALTEDTELSLSNGVGSGSSGGVIGAGGNVWLNLLFVVSFLGIGGKIAYHGIKTALNKGNN